MPCSWAGLAEFKRMAFSAAKQQPEFRVTPLGSAPLWEPGSKTFLGKEECTRQGQLGPRQGQSPNRLGRQGQSPGEEGLSRARGRRRGQGATTCSWVSGREGVL